MQWPCITDFPNRHTINRQVLHKNPSIPTPLPSATMLGTQIKPVTVAKDLGVYIDCHLNFNEHITKTASDCMFKLTRVNRIKHLVDKKNIDLSYKCFRFQQIILLFDGME